MTGRNLINPKHLIAALRALPRGCTVRVSSVSDLDVYNPDGSYRGWIESAPDGSVRFQATGSFLAGEIRAASIKKAGQ